MIEDSAVIIDCINKTRIYLNNNARVTFALLVEKHRKNCKTLPSKHLFGFQCVKLFLLNYVTITAVTINTVTINTVTITTVTITAVTITTVPIVTKFQSKISVTIFQSQNFSHKISVTEFLSQNFGHKTSVTKFQSQNISNKISVTKFQ